MKPCFVELTDRPTKATLWINMTHVVSMNRNGDQPGTVLVFSTGGIEVVEQSVHQILEQVPA